jgi:hypothetical protein
MGKYMVTFAIIGTDCIGRCKSSLRMIMDVMNWHERHQWCNGLHVLVVDRGFTSSVVDRGFKQWTVQTKKYKIGICCFSAKHAALRRKSKDWLPRNQDNASEWGNMSIRRLLCQWASFIKIQLSVLV